MLNCRILGTLPRNQRPRAGEEGPSMVPRRTFPWFQFIMSETLCGTFGLQFGYLRLPMSLASLRAVAPPPPAWLPELSPPIPRQSKYLPQPTNFKVGQVLAGRRGGTAPLVYLAHFSVKKGVPNQTGQGANSNNLLGWFLFGRTFRDQRRCV